MAKYRDSIETLITARNEVAGELQRAERQMRQQAGRERQREREQARAAKQREQAARQQLLSLGKVAAAVGGAQVAISSMNVATQIASGNMDAAADAAERMPLGIGEAVRSGRELWETLSGARAETEAMEKATEARKRAESNFVDVVKQRQEAEVAHAEKILALRQQTALLRERDADDREALQFQIQAGRDVRSVSRQIVAEQEKARDLEDELNSKIKQREGSLRALASEARDLEQQGRQVPLSIRLDRGTAQQEIRNFEDQIAEAQARVERLEQQRELMRRERDAKEAAREREQTAEQIAAEREREQEARKAAHETAQERRRLAGRHHAFEVNAIRERFRVQIREAREANNDELADQLRTRQQLETQAATEQERRRRREAELADERETIARQRQEITERIARQTARADAPALPTLNQDRFLTGVRQQTEQQDRAIEAKLQKQIDADKAKLDRLDAIQRTNAEIANELRTGPILRSENL